MSPERHVVVTSIARPDPQTVAGLAEAGVATAHECAGKTGLLSAEIRPIQQGAAIAGPAVTVASRAGDNLMVHAAVEVCQPGDVLVVATDVPSAHGMVGELIATSLMAHGVRGLVIDAGVRDVADLRSMGFPVWTRAVFAQGTIKASPGSVNTPVVCGGQTVSPGDVIVADDDGVMRVPREDAAEVLQACRQRVARESDKRKTLAEGALGVDLDGMRDLLARLGVRYVSQPPGGAAAGEAP